MLKIEYLEEEIPVYDITVEENHNFYANNVLIHNCTEINLPSFPDENFTFMVSDKQEVLDFVESLYEDGKWYQLYRYIYFKVQDDKNKEIISKFNEFLKEENEEVTLNFGETFSCILGGLNFGNLPDNVKERRDKIKDMMFSQVSFLDEMIDYQDYAGIDTFEKFTKNRRALGISPGNLFYLLAKKNYRYDSQEARDLINDIMEEVLYYGIEASVELAKIKGKCKYFADTKYSKGIFPIDTYNKNVDRLVKHNPKLDWEYLREEVKIYGMRNSTLLTAVPSSNSSRPANMISGINPPQALEYNIEDQKMKISGVLPEIDKYEEFYKEHICWELDTIEYWKLIAIFQKWTDQAISLNEYIDFTKYKNNKIPKREVYKRDMFTVEFGIKSTYYGKTKTDIDNEEFKDESNCGSGGCTL